MRIGFLGRTSMLYNAVKKCINSGHTITFIGTCKASPEYEIKENDFRILANDNGILFFCDSDLRHNVDLMSRSNTDVVLSMNWLSIIGEDIINLFPHGILNAHPGKLPRYRGNACPNWAIINGEKEFSITIHFMKAEELDAGDIILQQNYPINNDTSIEDVYTVLNKAIPELFLKALENICDKRFKPFIQDESKAIRCYPRIPSDSFIDWKCTCEEISRLIRASTKPFSGAYTYYENTKIYIHSCLIERKENEYYAYPGQVAYRDKDTGIVKIICGDGFVCISDVYIDSLKYRAADILKSTRIRLNYCIQDELFRLRKEIERIRDIMNLE